MRALDEGTHVGRDPQTLGEWIERWLETMVPRVRASTLRDYRNGLQRVGARLGSVQLHALRPLDLEELYADLLLEKNYQTNAARVAMSEIVVPDAVSVAMSELTGAMREGLLALAVGAGLQVMQVLMDESVTALAGPRGKHDPDRAAVRHGTGDGSVVLGGRQVPVRRPRVRTADRSAEVPVPAYELFASTELLGELAQGYARRLTTTSSPRASASTTSVVAVGYTPLALNIRRTASGAMPARRASSAFVIPCASRASSRARTRSST
jgi:hypothetical protein